MSFDGLSRGALNYYPCQYGVSRLRFRGPEPDLEEPYIAFLGATETFGPYLEAPFPDLVGEALGYEALNLGIQNAGPDVYLSSPDVIKLLNAAAKVVIQLPSAANLSNAYYRVHPRRNDRFLCGTEALVQLVPRLDLTEVHFTGHFWRQLAQVAPATLPHMIATVQQTWLERMAQLLARLDHMPVLLWAGRRGVPPVAQLPEHGTGLLTSKLVERLKPLSSEFIEVVPSETATSEGPREMIFASTDAQRVLHMLSGASHREIATALTTCLRPLIRSNAKKPAASPDATGLGRSRMS